MKAWFLTGPNEFRLGEVEEPRLRPGYVKLEVLTAQPSVTETNLATLANNIMGFADRVKAGEDVRLPGHEMCARVIEVNEGSKFKVGDRVASVAKAPCGECEMCRASHPRLCRHAGLLGVTVDGVFAERCVLPESGLTLVPDALSDSEAANLQPLGDCVTAIETLKIQPGDTVVVFGGGCLGLNTMQMARVSGAAQVIMVDIRDEALEIAKQLGADVVINSAKEDPVAAVKKMTGGVGADCVVEAAGGNPSRGLAGTSALFQAMDCVRPEGKILILAIYGAQIEFPIGSARDNGKTIMTPVMATPRHLAYAAKLIEKGLIQVKPLIQYTLEGIESVPQAFEITGNKKKYQAIMPAQVKFKD